MLEELRSMLDQVMTGETAPELLINRYDHLILHPLVLAAVFLMACFLVPLIEEFFKPVGVWFLLSWSLSPAEGFAAGAISGAGYALFESIALSSGGQEWLMVVVARMSTGVIHIFTSGMMGWALVQAWRFKRFWILAVTYPGVVLLHGLWNGLALLTALTTVSEMFAGEDRIPVWLVQTGEYAPVLLGGFTLLLFFAMYRINRRLASGVSEEIDTASSLDSRVIE